jgi:hypothetical protein
MSALGWASRSRMVQHGAGAGRGIRRCPGDPDMNLADVFEELVLLVSGRGWPRAPFVVPGAGHVQYPDRPPKHRFRSSRFHGLAGILLLENVLPGKIGCCALEDLIFQLQPALLPAQLASSFFSALVSFAALPLSSASPLHDLGAHVGV